MPENAEPGVYRYYSIRRPVDIGTYPHEPRPAEVVNFDSRMPVEGGAFEAWGYLEYDRPLTDKQTEDYELQAAPGNPAVPETYSQVGNTLGPDGSRLPAAPEPAISQQPGEARPPERAIETLSVALAGTPITASTVDTVLRDGGNSYNSVLRIAAYYMKDKTTAENADFLRREYVMGRYKNYAQPGGKGFQTGLEQTSVWFDETGLTLGRGKSALNAKNSAHITWEQAAVRVRELLDAGQYISADVMDEALDNEHSELAEMLLYVYRDDFRDFREMPEGWLSEKGGWPDDKARVKELLEDKKGEYSEYSLILERLEEDVAALSTDPDAPTRFWHDPYRILQDVRDAGTTPHTFPVSDLPAPAFMPFITEDEVDAYLARGSNVSEGKYRIFSFFLHEHTQKERADFLKNEYGHGGQSHALGGADNSWADSEPGKGIILKRGGLSDAYDTVTLTWSAAEKRINKLIQDGRYMNRAGLDGIAEYERMILARQISYFYYNMPEEYQRPFPRELDFYYPHNEEREAIGGILDNPERLDALLEAMRPVMENTIPEDRYYDTRKTAYDNLTAWRDGAYTLFPGVRDLPDPELAAAPRPRPNVQLSLYDVAPQPVLRGVESQRAVIEETVKAAEAQEAPAVSLSITQDEIDALLLGAVETPEQYDRIMALFAENPRSREAAQLIREIYSDGIYLADRIDGAEGYMGLMGDSDGVTISKGEPRDTPLDQRQPAVSLDLSWPKVHRRVAELVAAGQFVFQHTQKQTPSVTPSVAQDKDAGVSDEKINGVLINGPGYIAKLTIFEQYGKNEPPEANSGFLKHQYDRLHSTVTLPDGSTLYTRGDERGFGISVHDPMIDDVLLEWPEVERRVAGLIVAGKYLTPSEKAMWTRRHRSGQEQAAITPETYYSEEIRIPYHEGDAVDALSADGSHVRLVIGRVDESLVSYTMPDDLPEQEPVFMFRSRFEQYLDSGRFTIMEPGREPERPAATSPAPVQPQPITPDTLIQEALRTPSNEPYSDRAIAGLLLQDLRGTRIDPVDFFNRHQAERYGIDRAAYIRGFLHRALENDLRELPGDKRLSFPFPITTREWESADADWKLDGSEKGLLLMRNHYAEFMPVVLDDENGHELHRVHFKVSDADASMPGFTGHVLAYSAQEAARLISHNDYVITLLEPVRGEGPETPERTQTPEAGITPPATAVPAEPEPAAAPSRSYAVGDTVYLENDRPYVIESIDYDIRLRDPSLTYPITRSESREDFERLLLRNPNNKQFTDYLAADLDNVNGDLRDVLENGLLAPAFKADIAELIGAGAANGGLANYLSNTFPNEVYSITLETGETADYSTTPQGLSIEVLDKYDTTLGFSWADVAPIVRALSPEWEREPAREQPEPAVTGRTYAMGDTVYLENDKPFVIKWIGVNSVILHDESKPSAITELRDRPEFEEQLRANPRNAHMFEPIPAEPDAGLGKPEALGETPPEPEPDFDTVAQTVLERVLRDEDYLRDLTSATSRASLRNPCTWALEQSIRDHEQDEPAVYNKYFSDYDWNERLFNYILRESWANRPEPERAAEPEQAPEPEAVPESAVPEPEAPPQITQPETAAAPASPPPVFFPDWNTAQFDFNLNLYNDRDVVGYDKDGVKHAVGRSGRLTYVTSTGALWGSNEVPGNIYEQILAFQNGDLTDEQARENYLKILSDFTERRGEPAAVEPEMPPSAVTEQNAINEALREWNGDLQSKLLAYQYMRANPRARETAAFLRDEYGDDMPAFPVNLHGFSLDLPWPVVQRHLARLIERGGFLTPEEQGYADRELDTGWDGDESLPEIDATENGQAEPPPPAYVPVNYRITDDNLGAGGPKTRYAANIAAIRTLQRIEAEGRPATQQEQETLARYVGWGGLSSAFDDGNESWQKEYAELRELLTPEEYDKARASVLGAFYTPPVVVRAVYDAIGQMGFKRGNVLEPSCGTGNFFGLVPEEMRSAKLYGVELDDISARIAGLLYPSANILSSGFEKTNFPDSFFDVVIGNIPFGDYKVFDKDYNRHNFYVHDYFIAKSIDKVRAGGVVALVTSNGVSGGTFDKRNSKARRYMAERCDLIGAIRLPDNTFKAAAGTEMTTDILFLQKREVPRDLSTDAPDWVNTSGVHEHEHEYESGETRNNVLTLNNYYREHPEMVLGDLKVESGPFGPQLSCKPKEGDLSEQLREAVSHLSAELTTAEPPELDDLADSVGEAIPADPYVKNFSYTLMDSQVYYRENSLMYPVELPAVTLDRIRGMVELRDCVHTLIDFQLNDYTDFDIQNQQKRLNDLYDAFTAEYGLINGVANSRAFSSDSAYFLLCSLEMLDEDGNLERKADMFTKRTIKQKVAVTSVDTASEALAVSIGERARVDMDFMQELTGFSEEKLAGDLRGVIFRDFYGFPDGKYTYRTADEFLSGNVREKLAHYRQGLTYTGENHPQYPFVCDCAEALEKAMPKDLEASEIAVRLGSTWVDKAYVQQFMYELLQTPRNIRDIAKVNYTDYTGEWQVTGKARIPYNNIAARVTYGTERRNAYEIIEDTLNLRDVRVYDTVTENGQEKRVLNKKQTTLAQQKQEQIKQAFKDWIWKDPHRRQTLARKYNDLFNSNRPREYDGSHLVFSGMNPEYTIRSYQADAIARILYGGNTLLAHEVGAGKTFEMVAAAMEGKRLGLCNKSMFAVPNHIIDQIASDFLRLYPSANLLVATKKDFEMRNRKKFCAKIATGDYDAVIIGHSQLEKIPISAERQERLLQEQLWEIMEGIEELKANRGERFSIKQLVRTKKRLETRLEKLREGKTRDDVVTFEQLGVDRLFVDEAHNYKNLFLYTKMRNVAGLSTTEAQKSSDLFLKCRYMDELTAGNSGSGKGVIFATGTPVSNSMTELYTMQRYLQYGNLERKNLMHFDSWASIFGETVTAMELAPEGTGYRARTRFSRFHNLPELMDMFKDTADIKTADTLDLERPEAHFETIVVQPSELQQDMVQELSERAAAVHTGRVDPTIDNMLKITSDGRKIGLDQRLINPLLPDFEGSKVNACMDNVHRIWKETRADRLTQLVFCDFSTPNKDGRFNVYDDIKAKLLEKGVPEHEIAFIHDANTDARKKELFAKVRKGQVRVLFGSTFKMGAGTNVQDRLIAMHDLDCPWRPADLEQRAGRIVRFGNHNPEVFIYRYATEGTFDAYLWVRHEVA